MVTGGPCVSVAGVIVGSKEVAVGALVGIEVLVSVGGSVFGARDGMAVNEAEGGSGVGVLVAVCEKVGTGSIENGPAWQNAPPVVVAIGSDVNGVVVQRVTAETDALCCLRSLLKSVSQNVTLVLVRSANPW